MSAVSQPRNYARQRVLMLWQLLSEDGTLPHASYGPCACMCMCQTACMRMVNDTMIRQVPLLATTCVETDNVLQPICPFLPNRPLHRTVDQAARSGDFVEKCSDGCQQKKKLRVLIFRHPLPPPVTPCSTFSTAQTQSRSLPSPNTHRNSALRTLAS